MNSSNPPTHPSPTVSMSLTTPATSDTPTTARTAATGNASATKTSSSRNRVKKFRSAWLMFDAFKDWLRPHPSPYLAVCAVCKRVIQAGKSELEKHAAGKKHVRNLKTYYSNRGMVEHAKELIENNLNYRILDCSSDVTNTPDVDMVPENDSLVTPVAYKCPEICCRTSCEATVAKQAPNWAGTAVINGKLKTLKSTDYNGKFLVFIFYPRDFHPSCADEINNLSDRLSEFQSINAELVGCSTDSHLSHLAWVNLSRSNGGVENVAFPLLADPSSVIASDYGVYVPEKGYCLSGHFIIDCEGILRHISVNDPAIKWETNELLRLVRSCQRSFESEDFTDVDWAPNL